jgi:hypothetical protein
VKFRLWDRKVNCTHLTEAVWVVDTGRLQRWSNSHAHSRRNIYKRQAITKTDEWSARSCSSWTLCVSGTWVSERVETELSKNVCVCVCVRACSGGQNFPEHKSKYLVATVPNEIKVISVFVSETAVAGSIIRRIWGSNGEMLRRTVSWVLTEVLTGAYCLHHQGGKLIWNVVLFLATVSGPVEWRT